MNLLVLAAAALGAALLLDRRASSSNTMTQGPVTLVVGVPYRISVRANAGDGSPAVLAQAEKAVRASLVASGATDISITRSGSYLVISYRAVPVKSVTHEVGAPTSPSGTILSITRLDGRPIR